ncbi:hypothetical protein ACFPN2_00795 [Steroidobacter flavus]|uniref:Uncharacterized protein n=1 Tax=Steroidobacter flavus TaxID=1842136 RepID=A0ABV8SJ26_9GAMM
MSDSDDTQSDRSHAISFLVNLRDDPRLRAKALCLPNRLTAEQAATKERAIKLGISLAEYGAELKSLSDEELSAKVREAKELIEKRRIAEEAKFHFNQAGALADVSYWSVWPDWSIDERIALALDRDPRVVNSKMIQPYINVSQVAKLFCDLVTLAEHTRRAGSSGLKVRTPPGEFLRWVERTKLVTIPHRLVAALEERGIQLTDWKDVADSQGATLSQCMATIDQLAETINSQKAAIKTLNEERDKLVLQASSSGPWPWGNHETPLLKQLVAAAEKFWRLYDPSDPSTAPTNTQVKSWLLERNVPDRVAEVFAQALRPPDLPPGPRR